MLDTFYRIYVKYVWKYAIEKNCKWMEAANQKIPIENRGPSYQNHIKMFWKTYEYMSETVCANIILLYQICSIGSYIIIFAQRNENQTVALTELLQILTWTSLFWCALPLPYLSRYRHNSYVNLINLWNFTHAIAFIFKVTIL